MGNEFEFIPDGDGTMTLKSAVFQALGAASTCWSNLKGAGIFNSDFAVVIGETLLQKILEEKYPETIEGVIDLGPGAFTNGLVINYQGCNYYKACEAFVSNKESGGQTFCVKRVGHPGYLHEDYDGRVRGSHD